MPEQYIDIFDIIQDTEATSFTFENYYQGEREILAPALAKHGYKVTRWFDGERDSFGPLSRCALATNPKGEPVTLIYG